MKKKKRKINKKGKIFLISIFIIIILLILGAYFLIAEKEELPLISKNYSSYYNKYVEANKDAKLYVKSNEEFTESGVVYKGTKMQLANNYDKKSQYFKIEDLGGKYYISYNDIDKVDSYYNISTRYKNYIVFNKNIITDKETTFYSDDGKMYTIKEQLSLPIIIQKQDRYYVEYNNMLLYVLKDDISEVIDSNNTDKTNTLGVPVLNYHFVYNPDQEECDQEICHTEEQFKTHLSYIKDNNYFTPTMAELEMYMDGELRLPSSVVITLDDGRNINIATKILEEYQLNATAFIVTSRYDMSKDFIKSDYVEWQSHSHALHDAGTCPSGYGQGGGLTCLSDDKILEDLRLTREALNGATAFCYPFYEYNSHSIELLKQAGFTMAFAGEYAGGKTKATVGGDKYRIPRWVIVNWTTMDDFISYVSGAA